MPLCGAEDNQPYMTVPCSESKITSAVWGPLGDYVIAGHESGEMNQFSAKVVLLSCCGRVPRLVCPDSTLSPCSVVYSRVTECSVLTTGSRLTECCVYSPGRS